MISAFKNKLLLTQMPLYLLLAMIAKISYSANIAKNCNLQLKRDHIKMKPTQGKSTSEVTQSPPSIDIFDIDGTISKDGNDSWYDATAALTRSKLLFFEAIDQWKINRNTADNYIASETMMIRGVELLAENVDGNTIRDFIEEHTFRTHRQ